MAHRYRSLVALVCTALVVGACSSSAPAAESTTTSVSLTTEAPASSTRSPETTTSSTSTTGAPTATAPPTTLATATGNNQLSPRAIWLFPGPQHYETDVLSAQVPLGDFAEHSLDNVSVLIDGEMVAVESQLSSDPLLGGYITIIDVFDATDAVGDHSMSVTAEVDGEPIVVSADFAVLPETARAEQERLAEWAAVDTDCCIVHYLEASAAARDLETIVDVIDSSATEVEARFDIEVPRIEIVLLDVLWGNGGYAGGELVISYLDRDFGPSTAETIGMTFVHELTHGIARLLPGDAPWPLDEAIAVYVAGGHFKPEDLHARAAALQARGDLLPLDVFLDDFDVLQHETRYVQAGALATYLVETYGWESFLDIYETQNTTARTSRWFDRATSGAVGVGLGDIDAGFAEWVSEADPDIARRDLDLTIDLQDARRTYQATYAPYQNFFVYNSVLEAGTPAVALREARAPAPVAVEALISWAQHLIVEGRLDVAEDVVAEIEVIASTGVISSPYANRALAISRALAAQGYELLSFDLDGGTATVTATDSHPQILEFTAEFDNGGTVTLIGPVTETS